MESYAEVHPGAVQSSSSALLLAAAGLAAGTMFMMSAAGLRRGPDTDLTLTRMGADLREVGTTTAAPAAAALIGREPQSHILLAPAESFPVAAPARMYAAPPSAGPVRWSAPERADGLATGSDPLRKSFDGGVPRSAGFAPRGALSGFPSAGGPSSAGAASGEHGGDAMPPLVPHPSRPDAPAAANAVSAAPAFPSTARADAQATPRLDARRSTGFFSGDAAAAAIGDAAPNSSRAASAQGAARAAFQPLAGTAPETAGASAFGQSGHGAVGSGRLTPLAPWGEAQADPAQPADAAGNPAPAAQTLLGATFEWEDNQGAPIQDLTTGERLSACGLIAAHALQRFQARNVSTGSVAQIKSLAVSKNLWSENAGMFGSNAEKTLLADMDIDVDLVWTGGDVNAVESQMTQALAANKPVIVGTPRHYFFVEGYAAGQFFVGHTGEIMRGYDSAAGPKMSATEMSRAGAGIVSLFIPK